MKTIKSTLETEAIFSDDQQHRYLLKKTWNSENKRSQSSQCIQIIQAFFV